MKNCLAGLLPWKPTYEITKYFVYKIKVGKNDVTHLKVYKELVMYKVEYLNS